VAPEVRDDRRCGTLTRRVVVCGSEIALGLTGDLVRSVERSAHPSRREPGHRGPGTQSDIPVDDVGPVFVTVDCCEHSKREGGTGGTDLAVALARLRDQGGDCTAPIATAAARGLVRTCGGWSSSHSILPRWANHHSAPCGALCLSRNSVAFERRPCITDGWFNEREKRELHHARMKRRIELDRVNVFAGREPSSRATRVLTANLHGK